MYHSSGILTFRLSVRSPIVVFQKDPFLSSMWETSAFPMGSLLEMRGVSPASRAGESGVCGITQKQTLTRPSLWCSSSPHGSTEAEGHGPVYQFKAMISLIPRWALTVLMRYDFTHSCSPSILIECVWWKWFYYPDCVEPIGVCQTW